MLRFISIIGIAIAMLVGFIAISTKMKDDYTVRSRVVSVLKQVKNLAIDELQCGVKSDDSKIDPTQESSTGEKPVIEMSAEIETNPLIENAAHSTDDSSSENTSKHATPGNINEDQTASPDNVNSRSTNKLVGESTVLEGSNFVENADIIKTISYSNIDSNKVEVVISFNDVKGESGKSHIKSNSQVVIHCTCPSDALSCNTIKSNISKNYLPKNLTR